MYNIVFGTHLKGLAKRIVQPSYDRTPPRKGWGGGGGGGGGRCSIRLLPKIVGVVNGALV
jgi:hypothetical protein